MKILSRVLIPALILNTGIAVAQIDPMSILSGINTAVSIGKWITQDSKKVFYIQVESQGSSFEDAKQNAFKIAVERAVGALVLNETEVGNQDVIRNDVIMYSSGMIETYKVKKQNSSGGQVSLVMDVWVSDSRIANRLMTIGKGNVLVAGDQVVAREKSRHEEQKTGDKVINTVANDFPKLAFEMKIKNTQIQRQGRESQILVNTKLSWSKHYIDSLIDALDRTKSGGKGYPNVISVRPSDKFFVVFAGYEDREKEQILKNRFIDSEPMVQLTAFGNNSTEILIQHCYAVPQITEDFITTSKYSTLHIQGNHSLDLTFVVDNKYNNYNTFFNKIEKIKSFETRVVTANQCKDI